MRRLPPAAAAGTCHRSFQYTPAVMRAIATTPRATPATRRRLNLGAALESLKVSSELESLRVSSELESLWISSDANSNVASRVPLSTLGLSTLGLSTLGETQTR